MKPGSQSPIVKAQSSFRFRFLFKVTTNPLFIECRVISPSCDDDDRHNFDEFSAVEYYHDSLMKNRHYLAKQMPPQSPCVNKEWWQSFSILNATASTVMPYITCHYRFWVAPIEY
ncbi:hypothetical protein Salat_2621600 [Sesamum alatum]|uniref:Uncharacterized protein n=1 Tax=Sesamum alatum TaxID=300844 RepID=A0AAE2CAK3_9LAMI|nr:hypothetical protein Salat_2621600 [Sesamum alatum]